jgi:type I restriction enzyme S subunit
MFEMNKKIKGSKNLNVPNKGEQSQTCLGSAERKEHLHKENVPNLRFPEFSGEWEKTSIGKILTIGNGRDYKHLTEGNIPVFGTGGYMLSVNEYLYDGESVFIGRKGTINKPFFFSGKFWTVDTLFYTHKFVDVLPYFVYGLFQRINWNNYNEASGVPSLSKSTIEKISINVPIVEEQRKIANLMSLLDDRIATQIKIIEDLKKLKSAITHSHFNFALSKFQSHIIGRCITQVSNRNKDGRVTQVLSVSNKSGFINQSEQFEDREIASEDTTNYKIVRTNDFAYNPARINVGSIARLHTFSSGIVSPMYVCFHTKPILSAEYFEHFFYTTHFKHEMYKRLEGSVRLCLTYESLCNIKIALPAIEEQETFVQQISAIVSQIDNEEKILIMYQSQKQYLLAQMFI